jgi:hypothetical protein
MTAMLTQREQQLFDDLKQQYYAADVRPAGTARTGGSKAWLLEVAMGVCVAMIAVCGLLGSAEGVVCSTGAMMSLAFVHYHF